VPYTFYPDASNGFYFTIGPPCNAGQGVTAIPSWPDPTDHRGFTVTFQANETTKSGLRRVNCYWVPPYQASVPDFSKQVPLTLGNLGFTQVLQAYIPLKAGWRSDGIRDHALDVLGRTGLPEAIEYLSALTPEKLGSDIGRFLYPHAKLSLRKALFRREVRSPQQVAFLERAYLSYQQLCCRLGTGGALRPRKRRVAGNDQGVSRSPRQFAARRSACILPSADWRRE